MYILYFYILKCKALMNILYNKRYINSIITVIISQHISTNWVYFPGTQFLRRVSW